MADGVEGDSRLRVGPYPNGPGDAVAEPTDVLPAIPSPRPPDGPLSGATIQLPVIRPAEEPPTVRAVAKRAAAALPALGPASSRQEKAARAASAPDHQPAAPGDGQPAIAATADDHPNPTAAGRPYAEVPMDAGDQSAGRHGYDSHNHGVADEADDADDQVGLVLPADPQTSPADLWTSPADPWTVPADPWTSPAGPWTVPADPRTGSERPWHETGRPSDRPQRDISRSRSPAYAARAEAAEPSRPGPVVLDEDSWDIEPGADTPAGEYEGRRRGASRTRTWLGIVAALIVLAGAVGLPLLLNSSSQPTLADPGPVSTAENGALIEPAPDETTPDTQLGAPVSSGPAGPASTAASAGAAATSASRTTTPPTQPSTNPPAAQPETVQAEDSQRSGSAAADSAIVPAGSCGGTAVVSQVGQWNIFRQQPGTVTFAVAAPSAGTYAMTVYYAQSGENKRTAVITVNSGGDQNVTFTRTFGMGSCVVEAHSAINVTLNAGTNTIRFGNSDNRAPSLDRIVISQS